MNSKKKSNTIIFSKAMQKKLVVLYIAILLVFIGLIARVILITKEDGEQYKKQVLSQQEYSSTVLPYKRGSIMDKNGTVLAVSEKVYNVILDCSLMIPDLDKKEQKYLEPTLQAIETCFPMIDIQKVRKYSQDNPKSKYYVMAKQLSYKEIADFQELQKGKDDEPSLVKGVWFEESYDRKYPNNTLACDVLGFTGSDNNGSFGLEGYYNNTLNGVNGREYGYLNTDQVLERTTKPAVDGNHLVTTLDANVQAIVEKHILAFNEEHKDGDQQGNGSNNTAVIVVKPNSGEILAMASYPVYDPNQPTDLSGYYPKPYPTGEISDALEKLEQEENPEEAPEETPEETPEDEEQETSDEDDQDEESEVPPLPDGFEPPDQVEEETEEESEVVPELTKEEQEIKIKTNQVWRNFCISDTYEPGSTAKPFTMATGLEYGKLQGNETYECKGVLEVGGHQIHCNMGKNHGTPNLETVIAQSCNVSMMKIGAMMGKNIFSSGQTLFNFGLKTNVDLQGEARTDSLMFPVEDMRAADLAIASFGQGYKVTMIQMVAAFSALINGGDYYEPHTVSKIVSSDGSTVKNITPRVMKQAVSQSTSDQIIEYCNAAVMAEGGTGWSARPAGYTMGGKTGTAETLPRGNDEYVVSFIGYVPAQNPEILIYTVIDRPNVEDQATARYATVLTKNILTEILPYLNVFKTEEITEEEQEELDRLQEEITGSVSDNGVSEEGNAEEGNAEDGSPDQE